MPLAGPLNQAPILHTTPDPPPVGRHKGPELRAGGVAVPQAPALFYSPRSVTQLSRGPCAPPPGGSSLLGSNQSGRCVSHWAEVLRGRRVTRPSGKRAGVRAWGRVLTVIPSTHVTAQGYVGSHTFAGGTRSGVGEAAGYCVVPDMRSSRLLLQNPQRWTFPLCPFPWQESRGPAGWVRQGSPSAVFTDVSRVLPGNRARIRAPWPQHQQLLSLGARVQGRLERREG